MQLLITTEYYMDQIFHIKLRYLMVDGEFRPTQSSHWRERNRERQAVLQHISLCCWEKRDHRHLSPQLKVILLPACPANGLLVAVTGHKYEGKWIGLEVLLIPLRAHLLFKVFGEIPVPWKVLPHNCCTFKHDLQQNTLLKQPGYILITLSSPAPTSICSKDNSV